MDILSRLKEIVSFTGLSVRGFAIKCGISQRTLDNQIKGLRSVSLETIVNVLHTFPEISSEWLMRGVGSMLISQGKESAEGDRVNKLVDTIATLQGAINAKVEEVAMLKDRITQLENQLKSK
ncbi:MAG: XRE family transcriptional regulator [Muribaculaceae bacterium]|nr:XRE family transcriptional regulator [Muribaculaceae bacterium]